MDPAGVDGEVIAIAAAKIVKLPVTASIGGKVVNPLWTRLIYTGEIQVNAPIPADAPVGETELLLKVGSSTSPAAVTVFLK